MTPWTLGSIINENCCVAFGKDTATWGLESFIVVIIRFYNNLAQTGIAVAAARADAEKIDISG